MHNLDSVDPLAATQPIAKLLAPSEPAAAPASHPAAPAPISGAEGRRVKRLTYGDEPRGRSWRPDLWTVVGVLAVLLAVAFVVVAVLVSGNRSQPSYRPGYAPSGMGLAFVPVAAVA
ncbi:hypothetical protein KI427_21530 [Rhodococcus ruber]|uniref:hypothetical protein n=1 Tax=Rhodococcus TaxID=1827 RepID=UPI00029A0A34|nr:MULTISPECIES: hypothetical protein [Rhodococcus]ATQ29270.1 hypothetical protein CS378_11315 [Rhodococcus ruber]AXY53970.1 hypothetical protein YT1_4580 [Rhodococcus ruber]UQB72104.1 hypothetical protein KI427_21530 [Rhodococcus ruber]